MSKKPFIFNDEQTTNSYGFSIPTSGISLKRFKKNPVMLDSHNNSTQGVLGKWINVKADKGLLSGEPLFDSEDSNVTVIEGKVERGFISSCSMGIVFNREDLKLIAGKLILEKCELYEVSIVAVPSNANSIRLYMDGSKTPLSDQEAQTLCLSVLPVDFEEIPNTPTKPEINMKITLTVLAALALGFKADELEHEGATLSAKIVELEAQRNAATLKLSAMTTAQEEAKIEAIKTKVALAIKANPSLAAKEQDFINLGIANESLLDSTLEAFPVKASLAAQIVNTGGASEVKTAEDFQKLSLEAQLKFKAETPAAYQALFTKN